MRRLVVSQFCYPPVTSRLLHWVIIIKFISVHIINCNIEYEL